MDPISFLQQQASELSRFFEQNSDRDAISYLEKQHRDVDALFAQFEKTSDVGERKRLVQQLADSLTAHADIEELIFYPGIFSDNLEDKLREALEEHLSLKRLLEDLVALNPVDKQYAAKVKVLKEQVEHHVQEEEKDLFPRARREVPAEKMEAMKKRMQSLYEREMPQHPSKELKDQTDKAPSISRRQPHAPLPPR